MTPAKFMHTTFVKKRRKAPRACFSNPAPKSIPHVASGGRSETATITPMTALERPVVKDNVSAIPAICLHIAL